MADTDVNPAFAFKSTLRDASLPAIASAAVIVLPAWRFFAVAHLNETVALELARVSDPAGVILGVTITLLPVSAFILAVLTTPWMFRSIHSAAFAINRRQAGGTRPMFQGVTAMFAWAAAITLLPWITSAMFLGAVALLAAAVRRNQAQTVLTEGEPAPGFRGSRRLRAVFLAFGAGLIVAGAATLVIDDKPWLPPTQLTVQGHLMVGYVVSDSGDDLILLRDHDRTVQRIQLTGISKRELCDLGHGSRSSLVQLFLGRSTWLRRCSG